MQTKERKKLSLRPASDAPDDATPDAMTELLRRSISRKQCVDVVYNKVVHQVAPHILYTRHGDPHIDGVVLQRDGKVPQEPKISTFKLTGLKSAVPTGLSFEPHIVYNAADPKYEGTTLLAVEV